MKGSLAERLAHAVGRRDEEPNTQLAAELAESKDANDIAQVADLARAGSTAEQNDAIKVLYEIGARDASLLRSHTQLFLDEMHSANNRMAWGALTALAEICRIDPHAIAANLDSILAAADAGSVIAKDQAIQILLGLLVRPQFAEIARAQLLKRLETAAVNQLPMYAERMASIWHPDDYPGLAEALSRRLTDDMSPSKRRRIEKVIKKLR